MRKNNRPLGMGHYIARSAIATMAAAHHHTNTVHFINQATTKICETNVFV